jgi:hypothetical protein
MRSTHRSSLGAVSGIVGIAGSTEGVVGRLSYGIDPESIQKCFEGMEKVHAMLTGYASGPMLLTKHHSKMNLQLSSAR